MKKLKTDAPVVLITGAAKRVGASIARALHTAGYNLALHYRNSLADLTTLVTDLEALRPQSTLILQAELAETEQLSELIELSINHFGRLDGLVNNASTFYPTPIGNITSEQWNELFSSNAQAPFFLSQAAAPYLKQQGGAIVNLVDIYAERPLENHSVYCMAKAALAMMTLSLAKELGPEIRVNAVAPGAILWPESGKAYTDQQELISRTPLKRTGTADDVAHAVLWLLRDAAFVTGEIIRIDGGRSLVI